MGLGRHTVQPKRKLYGHNRLSRLPPVHNKSNQKSIRLQLPSLSPHSNLFVCMTIHTKHIRQLQQELTQARDFQYPAHWTEEQRESHRLRIKRLENELSWLKYES